MGLAGDSRLGFYMTAKVVTHGRQKLVGDTVFLA
jgi:hypothetical protein